MCVCVCVIWVVSVYSSESLEHVSNVRGGVRERLRIQQREDKNRGIPMKEVKRDPGHWWSN